jgi:hypothetical protein
MLVERLRKWLVAVLLVLLPSVLMGLLSAVRPEEK